MKVIKNMYFIYNTEILIISVPYFSFTDCRSVFTVIELSYRYFTKGECDYIENMPLLFSVQTLEWLLHTLAGNCLAFWIFLFIF